MAVCGDKELLVSLLSGSATSDGLSRRFLGVHFDSRRLTEGNLFIALKGKRSGEEFLPSAFGNGASLALVHRKIANDKALLDSFEFKDRVVAVDDTLEAFWKLSKWWRDQISARLIAVTGSLGKTTTKRILAALLSPIGKGGFSEGSFNNHIGVPYTLCSLAEDDMWGVLEVGMNHKGEIARLADLIKPDVGIITGIAPVHMEFFSSLKEVADAKCELLGGISKGGVGAVLNDNPELKEAALKAVPETVTLKWFGTREGSTVRLVDSQSCGLDGYIHKIEICGKTMPFKTRLLGSHNGINVAAALMGVISAFPSVDLTALRDSLLSVMPEKGRLNPLVLPNGALVLDDSYNSSPEALKESLRILGELGEGRKTVAVLGDMLELGDKSEQMHKEIGKWLCQHPYAGYLLTFGTHSKAISKEFKPSLHVDTIEELYNALLEEGFEIALVKGSRGMRLDRVVSMLRDDL
ncbi:MAG: UDP-N-acetylmuramoyl-tripeptide--D-alanyl-D-alanine ligase [Candidatus Dadabacteria bacterium]|nr:MAG: UDP-N-acetylmuramoyl-tripeptide--D-alanyl-D-alanine ligase [Candidatus Dadabacteria bacterium]